MVLSRQNARKPPTNISVDKRTVRIWSSSATPTPSHNDYIISKLEHIYLTCALTHLGITLTSVNGVRVRFQVCWQSETKEHGKPKNKEVPRGVQVHQLQVGEADSRDHTWTRNAPSSQWQEHMQACHLLLTKQRAEHSPQDGIRQRGKKSRELSHWSQDKHDGSSILHHASAANLHVWSPTWTHDQF